MGSFRSMEVEERRDALVKLGVRIGVYLPEGWAADTKLSEGEQENNDCFWYRYKDTDMRFSIAFDSSAKDLRINVRSWNWPTYMDYKSRGYTQKETVWPSELYDPKESSPDITCGAEREPATIARDIGRRFIPEYVRIYERCAKVAESRQKYNDLSEETWRSVCSLFNHDPQAHRRIYNALGDLDIEHRGGETVHLEGSVTLAELQNLRSLYKAMESSGIIKRKS